MRRILGAVVLALLVTANAQAEPRLYLIKRETVTRANRPTLVIKYLEPDKQASPRWTRLPLSELEGFAASNNGADPWALVSADLAPDTHETLAKSSDVVAFPADLATRLQPADVKALSAVLDGMVVPTKWITPALTWGDVEQALVGVFTFNQRLRGILGEKVTKSATLATTVKDLPAQARAALSDAADALKVSKDKMGPNDTLEDVLQDVMAQSRAKGERVRK